MFRRQDRSWKYLPDIVLTEVFSYLDPKDRFNASVVFDSWTRGLNSPNLWRSISCHFYGLPEEDQQNPFVFSHTTAPCCYGRHALKFAEKYGQHVKNLHLVCDPLHRGWTAFISVLKMNRVVTKFFKKLTQNHCELNKLMMKWCYSPRKWDNRSNDHFLHNLCEFIQTQHQLQFASFGILAGNKGLKLLAALKTADVSTIKTLALILVFSDELTRSKAISGFHSLIPTMVSLEHIVVSYETLSDDFLAAVTQCPGLYCLRVFTPGGNVNPPKIRSRIWREVCLVRPELQVHFICVFLGNICRYSDVTTWLPPCVPLVVIELWIIDTPEQQQNWNLTKFIEYIQQNFSNSLIGLKIRKRPMKESIDEPLVKLVQSCPRLKYLDLILHMSVNTIDEICSMQLKKRFKLQQFLVKLLSSSDEDRENLKSLEQRYSWLVTTQRLNFRFSCF